MAAGAAGGLTSGLLSYHNVLSQLLYGKKASELSADDKLLIANIVTLAGGAAGAAVNGSAGAGSGAYAGKTEVENNSLALVARACSAFSPCRNKVAEQLLEIGARVGLAGLAGVAVKDVADKMTSDELDHLVTLEMMGDDVVTGKYLSML